MNRPSQPESFDEDTTGMRRLLGSLPDPGPMPEELAARISHALQDEARTNTVASLDAHREGRTKRPARGDHAALWQAPATQQSSHGRNRWHVVAAVAAGVVLVGSAGTLLLSKPPADSISAGKMHFPSTTDSAPATGDDNRTLQEETTTPPGIADVRPTGTGPRGSLTNPAFVVSNTNYTDASVKDLTTQIPTALDDSGAAGSAAVGPLGSPLGVQQCIARLGISNPSRVIVHIATYKNEPAAVVVTTSAAGDQAHVVQRSCGSAQGSPLITGPITLNAP